MKASEFCDDYISNMLNGVFTFDSNYNLKYYKNIFYSYSIPICKYIREGENHIFYMVDRDKSPSIATSKHMTQLFFSIEKAKKKVENIIIETVQEIQREQNNEQ